MLGKKCTLTQYQYTGRMSSFQSPPVHIFTDKALVPHCSGVMLARGTSSMSMVVLRLQQVGNPVKTLLNKIAAVVFLFLFMFS